MVALAWYLQCVRCFRLLDAHHWQLLEDSCEQLQWGQDISGRPLHRGPSAPLPRRADALLRFYPQGHPFCRYHDRSHLQRGVRGGATHLVEKQE